jgi:hypothetical protein
MRQEYLRAVVWPRHPAQSETGKPLYRYAIVGILVSDTPIKDIEGQNEVVVDGYAAGISNSLEVMHKRKANLPTGDAASVMCSLDLL